MGFFEKISKGLKKTKDSMFGQMKEAFSSFKKIDEDLFMELEDILIMADVGVHTTTKIVELLREKVKKQRVSDPEQVLSLLKETMAEMMEEDEPLKLSTKPSVILVIGVNGVGKTTTIGKMAHHFKAEGKSVLLAAADTFRAAAIEQLDVWAKRTDCPMIKHAPGADPAAVVFDAMSAAKARGVELVICDTAGRLHNKKNLMDELSKISRVIQKEGENCDIEVFLVLDATTGQNAVTQARQFKEAADITGIVLTKLDGTAKGGVVIAIKEELDVPVRFVGVGEQMDDLQPFDSRQFVDALFDGEELK